MACSVCRKNGHRKNNCPIIEKQKQEQIKLMRNRINVIIQSPAFNTIASATLYAILSQRLQRSGFWENLAGESMDMSIILSGAVGMTDPALVIGALMSQAFEHTDFMKEFEGIIESTSTGLGGVTITDPETGETIYIPPVTGNGGIV